MAVLDLGANLPPPDDSDMLTLDKIHLFSRLSQVTVEELMVRTITSLSFWIMLSAVVNLIYSGMAFVAVGLNTHTPAEWPRLIGFFSDTWSVRQLWGYAHLERAITDRD